MQKKDLDKAIVTIKKEELSTLPPAEFDGDIFLVDSLEKLHDVLSELKKESIIGFDTETRPSFRKGHSYKVSLIQLSTSSKAYLFRTNIIGYPKELIKILEDPDILKVGLSIHDDFHNLRKVTEIEPQGFIDLQSYVKEFKIADNSLSRLYGILFGKRISKGQRLTNWESAELTDSQLSYAALDAYACVRIYEYLKEGNFNPYSSPYLTIPESGEKLEEQNND